MPCHSVERCPTSSTLSALRRTRLRAISAQRKQHPSEPGGLLTVFRTWILSRLLLRLHEAVMTVLRRSCVVLMPQVPHLRLERKFHNLFVSLCPAFYPWFVLLRLPVLLLTDSRRLLTDGWHLLTGFWRPMIGSWRLMTDFWLLLSSCCWLDYTVE